MNSWPKVLNWEMVELQKLSRVIDSGTWGDPATSQIGRPVLRSTNIRDWELDLKGDLAYRIVPERDLERRRLVNGDLIVTKSSGSPRLIGEAALVNIDDEIPYYFSNFMVRIRCNSDLIEPKFLYFYLRSTYARSVIADMHRTTSGLRNLQLSAYKKQGIPIPYPGDASRSLVEQRRIVARIEALLDEVREARKLQESIEADAAQLMEAIFRKYGRVVATSTSLAQMTLRALLGASFP